MRICWLSPLAIIHLLIRIATAVLPLFDGVVYLPELSGSRDTCVLEADESEGVFIAELDVDMLRNYRHCEVWGIKNRRPELYGEISDKSYIF